MVRACIAAGGLDKERDAMAADRPESKDEAPNKRQYPAAYERAVPIALVLITLAIVILLGIILVVALGLYPGG